MYLYILLDASRRRVQRHPLLFFFNEEYYKEHHTASSHFGMSAVYIRFIIIKRAFLLRTSSSATVERLNINLKKNDSM